MTVKEEESLIIIPAFNEAGKIGRVIEGIRKHLPESHILVIDDGSGDGTGKKALEAGAFVLSHPFNLGYGSALQTGYKYAVMQHYSEVVQIDGDGQHDPSCIPDLLDPVKKGVCDIVIGSRFLAGNKGLPYKAPFSRKVGIGLFRVIVTFLTGQHISDPTSGYQAMNRKVFTWFSGDRFPVDYPDADVIIMLCRAGFRLREIPVRMFESTDNKSMHSGLKPLYYVFKMLLSIFVTLMRK